MASMTKATERVVSDAVIHPGGLLAEEIEARGMTQRELAMRMGRPPQLVSEIVRGRRGISAETALRSKPRSARRRTSGWASTPTTASRWRGAGRRSRPPGAAGALAEAALREERA